MLLTQHLPLAEEKQKQDQQTLTAIKPQLQLTKRSLIQKRSSKPKAKGLPTVWDHSQREKLAAISQKDIDAAHSYFVTNSIIRYNNLLSAEGSTT